VEPATAPPGFHLAGLGSHGLRGERRAWWTRPSHPGGQEHPVSNHRETIAAIAAAALLAACGGDEGGEIGDDVEQDVKVEGTEEVAGQEAVRLATTSDEPGTITFSDFDEDLQVEAPPEDEIVDLAALGG